VRDRVASYRLYNCACCSRQVQICQRCDRGNRYCAAGCADQRRRESLRRAGARYQRSRRGARFHAARQRRWRERAAQKVTHQGSAGTVGEVKLKVLEAASAEIADDARILLVPVLRPQARPHRPPALCSFCGTPLPEFARLGPLRSGP
jgi:hypothetical protein